MNTPHTKLAFWLFVSTLILPELYAQADPTLITPAPQLTRLKQAPLATTAKPNPEPTIVRSERSIYLPYEDLEKVFEKEGRGVFLPYREFLDLWNELTLEREKDKIKPPTDGVIASAQYHAKVEGNDQQVLAIDATIELESFKEEGWAVIPLAGKGLQIAAAETGDVTLHLGKDGYQLIVPKKGTYQIKLKLYAKISQTAGKQDVQVKLPSAGVSRFTTTIPETGWDFELQPAAAYSTIDRDNETELSFVFGENEHFQFSWQKQGEETQLTPLLFVEGDTKTSLLPGALQSALSLDYRILRAGVDQFNLQVPSDQEVLSVDGKNIKQWDVTKTANGDQQLSVELHAPAKKNYQLKLLFEQALASLPTEVSLPQIVAENVVRQRGTVFIENSSDLELETVATDGLTQQSLGVVKSNSNDISTKQPFARYRYLELPFTLALRVKQAEPVVEVNSWTRYQVDPDSTQFETRFDYQIKRAGIFETQIVIPKNFDSIEAIGQGVKDFNESTIDGQRLLTVMFNNRTIGNASFSITGRNLRANPDDATTVPVFSPQNVDRHQAKMGLSIHSSLNPKTSTTGDLRQQDVSLLGTSIPGSGSMQIGFRYRGNAKPATVTYTLKKPRVTGKILTMIDVKEQTIRYQWKIGYQVKYAGVDTFILSLPEAIAEDLRHEGLLIKEVDKEYTNTELNVPNGHTLWKISLRDKQIGDYNLELTLDRSNHSLDKKQADQDRSAAGDARDFIVTLPEIQMHQVQSEKGQIGVIKDDSLEILDAQLAALESVDPKDLDHHLQHNEVFLAYQYRRHPYKLKLKVSRNEFLPVPQAVVTYADLTSVLSTDAELTTQVIYWVKNNAKQFFSLTLPENGRIVSDVYVNGKPQQPMRRANEKAVLIRLPANQASKQFPIRFLYEVPSRHPGKKLGQGSVKIPVVELNDAEILQTRINLYLPEGYNYRRFKSAMTLPISERGWTRFRHAFDWLIPNLGPQIPIGKGTLWADPPTLPKQAQAGFDISIPTGGKRFTFHRLDQPALIKAVYRSQTYSHFIEALAGLLAFAGAILMAWRSVPIRFLYFTFLGLLPLIIAGVVSPNSASFWTSLYLGTILGAVIWFLKGAPLIIKSIAGFFTTQIQRFRDRPRKAAPQPPVEAETTDEPQD